MSSPPAGDGARETGDEHPRAAARGSAVPDDQELLTRVRSLFEAADPVPAGLTERVRFAVALAGLEGELARLTDELYEHGDELAAARGGLEESRTITFDSTELTIMIRIDSNPDGSARVDGWLAPPRCCPVEIALVGGAVRVNADDEGRFSFPAVPRGTVRLVVRPPGAGAAGEAGDQAATGPPGGRTVITPALVLLADP